MEATSQLRLAVLAWLEQARDLPSIPQAITDVALSARPEFEAVINAVVGAAPRSEHRDLYGKVGGDWLPRWSTLLRGSRLGDATRLVAQGASVPVDEVADSFVAFCTAPAPAAEDWLLLTGDLPVGAQIPLGRYTLQAFTADELRQLGPMPALQGLQPGWLDLDLLAGAPFVHAANPERAPDRRDTGWFDFAGRTARDRSTYTETCSPTRRRPNCASSGCSSGRSSCAGSSSPPTTLKTSHRVLTPQSTAPAAHAPSTNPYAPSSRRHRHRRTSGPEAALPPLPRRASPHAAAWISGSATPWSVQLRYALH